ncbi:DNA adenine methylase [Achromobacter pestifer]|nr:DNA adenine methylase [Achromobacter pestifer]
MTFRANMGVGRHGWLRLTPAYGVRIVRERIAAMPSDSVILDPFSGTGTTTLAAAERGHFGQSTDVNPFLVWLGNTKLKNYSEDVLLDALEAARSLIDAHPHSNHHENLWQPNIHNIERWWSPGALQALKILRHGIDKLEGDVRNLLDVAFCRTLIACSNAAFNHQSMSFKESSAAPTLFNSDEVSLIIQSYYKEIAEIVDSARFDLAGSGVVVLADARAASESIRQADCVVTSPPYVNRMSYIRELRPYMYWLRYLDQASDAGNLDWKAIGGTWGTATTKVGAWSPEFSTPVEAELDKICAAISSDGGKNGPLLANYVRKYHHDMWLHFQAVTKLVKKGGTLSYIVGNSTFYGHDVPAQELYAEMLRALGCVEVEVETIRKRNSNKRLFEYDVTATLAF